MINKNLIRKDLIHPNLCYQVMGILFEVRKKLGYGHKEKFYQKAISQDFKTKGFHFKEQLPAKIHYKGKFIGIYYFDFLIEDKIVLEIKIRNYFSKKDINQLF